MWQTKSSALSSSQINLLGHCQNCAPLGKVYHWTGTMMCGLQSTAREMLDAQMHPASLLCCMSISQLLTTSFARRVLSANQSLLCFCMHVAAKLSGILYCSLAGRLHSCKSGCGLKSVQVGLAIALSSWQHA